MSNVGLTQAIKDGGSPVTSHYFILLLNIPYPDPAGNAIVSTAESHVCSSTYKCVDKRQERERSGNIEGK